MAPAVGPGVSVLVGDGETVGSAVGGSVGAGVGLADGVVVAAGVDGVGGVDVTVGVVGGGVTGTGDGVGAAALHAAVATTRAARHALKTADRMGLLELGFRR
jgi:hypothetical protein